MDDLVALPAELLSGAAFAGDEGDPKVAPGAGLELGFGAFVKGEAGVADDALTAIDEPKGGEDADVGVAVLAFFFF